MKEEGKSQEINQILMQFGPRLSSLLQMMY